MGVVADDKFKARRSICYGRPFVKLNSFEWDRGRALRVTRIHEKPRRFYDLLCTAIRKRNHAELGLNAMYLAL